MAKHPGTITSLRYANRRILEPEQQLQRNYFRELIHSYGVDASYFRHNVDAYQLSGTDFDYIYGEQPAKSFWLSAHVVIYMESKGDIELLNKFGFETDGDMEAFILIDDFTEQFRDLVGTTTSANFVTSLIGAMTSGTGYVSGSVSNSILDGWVIDTISGNTSGYLSGTFDQPFVRNPRLYNDYVYKTESYDDRNTYGTLSGSWSTTLDNTLNGEVSGSAEGILGYHIETSTVDGGGPNWNIAPKAGDFFRLDFHDENHEEYEITKVIDRNLQIDGLNPLLSKYVWQMTCVRRDPSYEDVIGASNNIDSSLDGTDGRKEEEFTNEKYENNEWIEDSSNDIFDYSEDAIDDYDGINSDDVYGGYDID